MKEHVHEIEVKYVIQPAKVKNIAAALEKLGFTHKSTTTVTDRWLRIGKDSVRLREQKKGANGIKYFLASKKTIEKDDGLKNKCEAECKINKFTRDVLLKLAKQKRRALPIVHKSRTSWTAIINDREYTAVIDHVEKLGEFNGYYFELETLIPFDVNDPGAKADVKALASKILTAAYKGAKGKPTECEQMSYRRMALAYMAKQRKAKQNKAKQVKPKPARTKQRKPKQCIG